MKHEEDSLVYPPIEKLLEKIPQRYELVLTATRRAKQIIREMRLNPMAYSEEDRKRKPLNIALMDIIEGRVDQQALMSPDIEFDDLNKQSFDSFSDVEELARPLAKDDDAKDGAEPTSDAVDNDDDDDLGDVVDRFNLEDNDDS
jgi:DNA-directed RNA polymerase omega subunit